MNWEMHEKEFESVVSLPGPERYRYAVKKIADWENVWGLSSDSGWAMSADDDGHHAVPIWPHPEFAGACANGEWAGDEPRAVPLDDWLAKWIPGMTRDNLMVAVFPTPRGKGVVVTPERLRTDLEDELQAYEEP